MRNTDMVSFAWGDLLQRRGSAWVVGFTLFGVAVSVLLLSFYGLGVRDHLHRSMEGDLLSRVAVDFPTGQSLESGREIKDWQALPSVAGAWPRVEVTADVLHGETKVPMVPVEGVSHEDPILQSSRMLWGKSWSDQDGESAVISERMLRVLGGQVTSSGPSVQAVTLELSRRIGGEVETRQIHLAVRAVLAGAARSSDQRDTLLVPLALTKELDQWLTDNGRGPDGGSAGKGETLYTGATVYALDRNEARFRQDLADLHLEPTECGGIETIGFKGPAWVGVSHESGIFVSHLKELAESKGAHVVSLVQLGTESGSSVTLAGLNASDPRWERDPIHGRHYASEGLPQVGIPTLLPEGDRAEGGAPKAVGVDAVMTMWTMAYRCWLEPERPARRWRADLLVETPTELRRLRTECEALGLQVEPITSIDENFLRVYSLRDLERDDGLVSAEVLEHVDKARASVEAVVPYCEVRVEANTIPFRALGTHPRDPLAGSNLVLEGGWVTGPDAFEVVLPIQWTQRGRHAETPASQWIGQEIPLKVKRDHAQATRLPVVIKGFTRGEDAYVGVELAAMLHGCLSGDLEYDEQAKRFVAVTGTGEARGAIRATVMTDGVSGLRAFMAHVEPKGFVVHHSLSELERAREWGNTIALFAAALCFVAIGLGVMATWSLTKVYMRTKRREIGILRSLGLAPYPIAQMFGLQAVLMGLPAFAAAVIVVVAAEPSLTRVVEQAIGAAPGEALREGILALGQLPLLLIALGCTVLLAAAASGYVAWRAARAPIAASLTAVE